MDEVVMTKHTTEGEQVDKASPASMLDLATSYANSPGILFCVTVGEVLRFGPVSRTFLAVTGLAEDQVVGRPVQEVIPERSRALVLAKYAEAIRSNRTVRWEESSTYATGIKHGEVTVTPVCDAGGACTHLVGIVHDVTERWQAEADGLDSEQKYSALIEVTGTGYVILDTDGTVVDANQEYIRLTGNQRIDQILGRSVVEWTAKHDQERNAAEVLRCLEDGSVRQLQLDYVNADGRITPIEVDARVWKTGSTISIVALCREITARRKMEAALRASEERLAQLVHTSPVVLYTCSVEAPYGATFVGENMKEQFGYQAWEFVQEPSFWASRLHPDDAPRVLAERKEVFQAGVYSNEYRFCNRDGSYRWVHDSMKLVWDASGRPVEIIGYWADISARKYAENALRAAEQRKDDFLAVLSHELRNPLMPIRNSVYLLDKLAGLNDRGRAVLAVINRQVTQLTRMVDDLLDVTRISRGKIRLQRERIELGRLVRNTVDDYHSLLEGLNVVVRLPEEAVWAEGDPARLAQVVGNLLNNAAKFTPKGGTITLELSRIEGSARLEVMDTGIGMEQEILKHVFEPFLQADRTLDRSRGGLGLGLALVKGLVEQHGGTVLAHSDGLGQGARFTIDLPLGERETVAEPEDALRHGGEGGRAVPSVLIIEDNDDAADTLRDILQIEGYRVHVARSGRAGLAAARELRPGVVLCDIGLPEMDGYAVASALRQDATMASMYLVALTGYAQPDDMHRALRAGFDAHLAKPPNLENLKAILARSSAGLRRS